MATQRGFDTQLAAFRALNEQYWKVRQKAERSLHRLAGALNGSDLTSGDPILDYCLGRYGLYCEQMRVRYELVNEILAGHTGQLVLTEWNERLGNGASLQHFKLGVLTDDKIQFPHHLNCIMPVESYVTHEDLALDAGVRKGSFHEGNEFFVPEHPDPLARVGITEMFLDYLGNGPGKGEHPYQFATVIAGDSHVYDWFSNQRCGVPGGKTTFLLLEVRLRGANVSQAIAS